MIYLFTGSGNSLWCARTLAAELDERTESLVPYKDKPLTCDDELVGFVMPTYMGDIPWLVKSILLQARVSPSSYAFVVMTSSGGASGSSFDNMDRALVGAGSGLSAAFDLQMPGNCVVSTDEQNAERLAAAPDHVDAIARAVRRRERTYESKGKGPEPGFVEGSYFYGEHSLRRLTMMKGFSVTDACTGCGVCASVCPMGNIHVEGGRAVHGDECAACYACLHWCPEHATLLKLPMLRNRPQYHHPQVSLGDVIKSNDTQGA
ncbi:MAG: ferredoxin family protein [Atopobiaceae bacterium]|jgi:ferredoxin|nr:ferredoxin family protein [Atopobiaceae bacterium]MCI2174141.1 ferredoxin family protein [Atopobiaceae bacterium]MCI2206782.1 ferredoxin family protein [Atopobiaceae bacterium]